MNIYIKNNDTILHTWSGQQVQPSQYYLIESNELNRWQSNAALLADITNGTAIVARDNSGNEDIIDINEAIDYLKENDTLVVIQEESPNATTGGTFQAIGFEFDITANATTQDFNISFPYAISLFSAEWVHKVGMDTDIADFIISPEIIIGAITEDVSIDDQTIKVSQTVLDNTKVGRELILSDGSNEESLGVVTYIDDDNSQVIMEKKATQAYSATTPTYVKQNVYMAKNLYMEDIGGVELGKDVIGGSYIPAGYGLRMRYHNNSGMAKKFRIILEIKY